MFFKRFMDFMLSNRFMRFLALILLYVIIFVPTLIIGLNVDNTALIFTPTIIFAVCIFGQLFGDIMNVDTWLNNGFATFLKRVIFFAVVLVTTFFGAGVLLGWSFWNAMMEKNATFLEIGINMATVYTAPIALLTYVFGYIKHSKNYHSEENKKWMPFFFLIAYVASMVVGIVTALILTLVKIDSDGLSLVIGLMDVALIAVAVIVSIKTGTWVFEEEAIVYSSSSYSSSSSSSYSGKSEYQRFREKCSNCVHLRDCTLTENESLAYDIKRHVHYCNLTGEEIYSIYSYVCSNFEERY